MAQHVIPATQLVPQYKPIGRCNNYAVLQSIPCSPECKIVGLILLDHYLSHALTATADVLAVYLQQFWRTVSKVPDTEDTIKFLLDTEQFVYIVVMFRDTLQLPVETPENPFVAPANIHTIEAFMNRVGYQGVVDKKKEAIQYPQFTKLIIADLMKKFPNIPKRIEEDYHSIKDDVPLVSVYTTGNVSVRGMLILDAFLTAEIRETDDFKEYETVFMKVAVPMNQPQPVVSTQGTNRNTPRAHRSPTISANPLETKKRKQTARVSSSPRKIIKQKKQSTPSIPPPGDDRERDAIAEATLLSLTLHKTALLAKAQENIAKVQEKLDEEEIDKMVEGSIDDESYASEFADSILSNEGVEVDDTGSKIEPGSQKENPERVSDDDETEKEKEVEQDIEEKETAEVGTEQNIVEKEVEDETNVEAETTKEVVKETEIQEVLQHCDTIVPELTVTKTNEMLKKEMPRLVKLVVNKDREVSPVDISGMNTTLNLYPKTSSLTATTSSADIQQQLYRNMKTKPQDQAADPEIWEILKAKFEKP
ncbi:hypothetical protein Tco_1019893 [Tanacetum coccineum]|uniref:Uncharacterized protein n=1 Tax=Tanacetum coccineum TaxID=301880 RepID=A0ABQ5FYG2_9ASTR